MELRVLKYFLMIAREENITRAAQLLHITQPTLSRQMMQLEEELGVTLFRRSRYRILLTDDGLLLKRRAQEIVALAEKAERELTRREEVLSGELAIGSGDLKSFRFLSDEMQKFQAEHPLVTYDVFSGHSDQIRERLEQGTLDFGLLLEPVDITRYDFLRLPVRERWCALMREDSPLAGRESVSPEDLARCPLILSFRESVRNELRNWFGPWADGLDIRATGNLPYNMAGMVQSGLGISVNLMLDCAYEGLRQIPLSPELTSGTVLVWKKADVLSPAVQAFVRFFKNAAQA